MVTILLAVFLSTSPALSRAVLKNDAPDPGSCGYCHGAELPLGADHAPTKGMLLQECLECHRQDSMPLYGRLPLSHLHYLRGVSCDQCHEKEKAPEFVGTQKCYTCHGNGDDVAGLTQAKDPNPHNSLHYGTSLDCDLCHHFHRKSENYCNQCHEFKFIVP